MEDDIKIGDIVRQTEGGPLMVVVSVHTTPTGLVMVGCEPIEAQASQSVSVPIGDLSIVH